MLPAAFVLVAGVAITAPLLERNRDGSLEPPAEPVHAPPGAFAPPPTAVSALRTGECDRAVAEIEPASVEAEVLAGLYANACGSHAVALRRLGAAGGYAGPLADWRLWALATSATELGQPETAQRAFTALASEHPDSPLVGPAVSAGAELALERDDLAAVDGLTALARTLELPATQRARIESVAWLTAVRRKDTAALERGALRLLVDHPLAAAELEVVETLRQPDGSVDWPRLLTSEQLTRRARALLAADLANPAVDTMDEVPAAQRDREWTLLLAEALTRAHRGAEALEILEPETGETAAAETRIDWRRAQAALEASVARRGRSTSAADRRAQRQAAHRHLRHVVALGTDPELSQSALRILFADFADDGRFDAALDALRALRDLDPADDTGAGYLWRRGWREFERRNHSSAIGYWAELRKLYPDSTSARRALYWSGRAHQELGNRERSQALFLQVVAAPPADFYHRHAMEWLIAPPPASRVTQAPAVWPRDSSLVRARWLSDLGLDDAARVELDLTAGEAQPRAVRALKAEILARQGETRRSIIELRRAFPELGTHRQHRAPREALRLYYPVEFNGLVNEAARKHDLRPHLVFAMIRQESAFDSGAHSRAGARGLMQVMPATGRELAGRLGLSYDRARLVEPGFSVQLGTAYYRQVLRSFGDEELALAGYNGGPNRIRRLWNRSGDWSEMDRFIESLPLDETRTYVQRIVLLSNAYRDLYEG